PALLTALSLLSPDGTSRSLLTRALPPTDAVVMVTAAPAARLAHLHRPLAPPFRDESGLFVLGCSAVLYYRIAYGGTEDSDGRADGYRPLRADLLLGGVGLSTSSRSV